MLQVKFDGQIEVATFTGTASHLAVVDQSGKRYALLENSKTGALAAWSGDTDENSVACVIVEDFSATEEEEEIQHSARLAASCYDRRACAYAEGTAAHAVWMKAFEEQCDRNADDADSLYEMHQQNHRYA